MASAEETIERAHAAVVALYDAGDVARREAANAHLVALREDPSAVDVALALLERARGELNRSLEEARATLRGSAEDLATAAAEQILGRSLS